MFSLLPEVLAYERVLVTFDCVGHQISQTNVTFFTFLVPPIFVIRPKDQNVVRGQKASLVCQVSGDPSPVITWYTRGSIVQNSSLYVVSRDGIVLFVNSVTDDNSGLFQCVARNDAGETSANINLFVVGKQGETQLVEYGKLL